MSRLWKDLKTNWMYWRYRNITRNRIRAQVWWSRRRQGARPLRPRGSAQFVYRRTGRKSWITLLAMVAALTALKAVAAAVYINPGLVYGVGSLIVVGAVYWALRTL